MAEDLGEAQLRLTVDLEAFKSSLREAKALVARELGDAALAPGGTGGIRGGRSGAASSTSSSRQSASQVSGRLINGLGLPNSPFAIDRSRRIGGPSEPIRGRVDLAGSPRFLEQQQRDFASAERQRLAQATKDARDLAALERQAQRERAAQINEGLRIGRLNASPVSGRLANGQIISGSPADRQRQARAIDDLFASQPRSRTGISDGVRQRAGDALGSGIIGGAFPLLFGQGVGASVGGGLLGAAGGAVGGQFGFGLSLIGTALGQQVDAAVSRLSLLGSALDDPIRKFQELAQAGLISSKSLEKNISALIDSGREAEAAARIQLDIAQQFGDVSELDALSDAAGELQRSFASATTVLAKFIAGPLADFTNKLALSFSLIGQRGVVNERAQELGLTNDQRTSIVGEARNNVGGDPTKLYEEVNRLLDERFGKTKQVLEAERLISEAQSRQNDLLSNSYRQVDAEAFGNRRLAIEKELEAIELRRKESLAVPGLAEAQAAQVNRDAALNTYRLKQDIARLDRDTWAQNIAAANQLKSIQEEIAIEQQRPGLTGTGVSALQAVKALEDAKRAEQDAQAALRTAPGDNSLLNSAKLASEQVQLAAAKTKSDLLDAYKSAQDSVKSISRSIEDAVTQLQQLQNTSGGGLNEFLSPQQVANNQAALNQQLRSQAQEISARRGLNFNVAGTTEQRNDALLRLIQADRQQNRLEQDLAQSRVDLGKAQNDLATVNASLVTVNSQLADATNNLASKDWNVNVAVNANTGAYAVQLG